jgi:hypothetical protein
MGWRREGDTALQQKAPDLVDQGRATLHPSIPNSVHGLHIELLLCLDLHKAHVLFGYRFGDRFRIQEVILVRLAVRLHELGGDEPHFVTLFSECGSQKVCSGTRLQADQRGRQIRCIGQQLRTGKLLADENFATFSQCNQVKVGLAQIDADGCDLHGDDPP